MVYSYPSSSSASFAAMQPPRQGLGTSPKALMSQVPAASPVAGVQHKALLQAQATTGPSEVSGDQANDLLQGGAQGRQAQAMAFLQKPGIAGLLAEKVKEGLGKLSSQQSALESKNGLIGSLWDGAKATLGSEEKGRVWFDPRNLLGLHKEASSGQIRSKLADSQNGVIVLESLARRIAEGDDSALPKYLEQYEKVTGAPLNPAELAKTEPSAVMDQTKIAKQVANYKDSQHLGQEIIKDVTAGVVAVGAVALAPVTGGTSLLLAAGVGAATRLGMTTANEFTATDDKFEVNLFAEAGKGAMSGGMALFGEGIANAAGRAVAKRLSLEIAENGVKHGAASIAKNATAKTFGSTTDKIGSRFLGQNFTGYTLKSGTPWTSALAARGTGIAVAGVVEGGSVGFVNTKLDGKSWGEAAQAGAMGAVAGVGLRGAGDLVGRGLNAAMAKGSLPGASSAMPETGPSPAPTPPPETGPSPAPTPQLKAETTHRATPPPEMIEADPWMDKATTSEPTASGHAGSIQQSGPDAIVAPAPGILSPRQQVMADLNARLGALPPAELETMNITGFKNLLKAVDSSGEHTAMVLARLDNFVHKNAKTLPYIGNRTRAINLMEQDPKALQTFLSSLSHELSSDQPIQVLKAHQAGQADLSEARLPVLAENPVGLAVSPQQLEHTKKSLSQSVRGLQGEALNQSAQQATAALNYLNVLKTDLGDRLQVKANTNLTSGQIAKNTQQAKKQIERILTNVQQQLWKDIKAHPEVEPRLLLAGILQAEDGQVFIDLNHVLDAHQMSLNPARTNATGLPAQASDLSNISALVETVSGNEGLIVRTATPASAPSEIAVTSPRPQPASETASGALVPESGASLVSKAQQKQDIQQFGETLQHQMLILSHSSPEKLPLATVESKAAILRAAEEAGPHYRKVAEDLLNNTDEWAQDATQRAINHEAMRQSLEIVKNSRSPQTILTPAPETVNPPKTVETTADTVSPDTTQKLDEVLDGSKTEATSPKPLSPKPDHFNDMEWQGMQATRLDTQRLDALTELKDKKVYLIQLVEQRLAMAKQAYANRENQGIRFDRTAAFSKQMSHEAKAIKANIELAQDPEALMAAVYGSSQELRDNYLSRTTSKNPMVALSAPKNPAEHQKIMDMLDFGWKEAII